VTLIVGIKCSDGVVIGADGAATLGSFGQQTARQSVKKLTILEEQIIVGVSGFTGLSYRLAAEFQALWTDKKLSGKKPAEALTIVRDKLWAILKTELEAAATAKQVIGQPAIASAVATTLVALPLMKEACLLQFDAQGAPDIATHDLPFAAIGLGQATADPFLAFLRRVFWPDRSPNWREGVLTVLWTLDHAIKTMPGGVADPVQVAVLRQQDDRYRASELTREDLEEHRQAISAAEKTLSDYLCALHRPPKPDEVPPPPRP